MKSIIRILLAVLIGFSIAGCATKSNWAVTDNSKPNSLSKPPCQGYADPNSVFVDPFQNKKSIYVALLKLQKQKNEGTITEKEFLAKRTNLFSD